MKLLLKSVLFTTIVSIAVMIAMTQTSCRFDKCKPINCAHNGVCNQGTCICPTGYEGPNCETITRNKFTGNWMVFEKGSASIAAQYPIIIDTAGREEAITYVVIKNLYNYFKKPVRAYVDGNRLIIPNQNLEGKVVFGEGILNYNVTYSQYSSVTMRYLVQDTFTLVKDDFGYEAAINFSDPSVWNK